MKGFVVGDVLVNAEAVKCVSVEEGNVLEVNYIDNTITQIQFNDYGTAVNAYKSIADMLGATQDLGGTLVV